MTTELAKAAQRPPHDETHDWIDRIAKLQRPASQQATPEPDRCKSCDDTGHVHDQIGEWRDVCNCGLTECKGKPMCPYCAKQATPEPCQSCGGEATHEAGPDETSHPGAYCDGCGPRAKATPEPVAFSHAGHFYNLVSHALMDVKRPDACGHRLRLILDELATLMGQSATPEPVGEPGRAFYEAHCFAFDVRTGWGSLPTAVQQRYALAAAKLYTRPAAAPAVPEGFALVPVEPEREMMEAMPSMPAIGVPGDMELKAKGWSLKAIQNRHRWLAALAAAQKGAVHV